MYSLAGDGSIRHIIQNTLVSGVAVYSRKLLTKYTGDARADEHEDSKPKEERFNRANVFERADLEL